MSAMVSRIRHHLSACRCCRGAGRLPAVGLERGEGGLVEHEAAPRRLLQPGFFGGCTRFRLHPILTPDNQLHGSSEVFLFMAVTVEA